MPGFDYCWGGMTVKLKDVESPDTIVRLNINNEYFEVKETEEFLDGKCSVINIEKSGIVMDGVSEF